MSLQMNRHLHERLNTVEELRARIKELNSIIISSAYHNLKQEPYSTQSCLRQAQLWYNGQNPYGGKEYPVDDTSDAED